MNRPNRTLYLLLATLATMTLATGCGRLDAGESRSRKVTATINRTWPADAIRELEVTETNGSISIEAAAVPQITLEARAHGDFEVKKGTENDGLFETVVEGDTLRIGGRKRRNRGFRLSRIFNWGGARRIDYTIRVPHEIDVAVTTVNGRIVTRGVDGETTATSVNGTIDVESSGDHELTATTVNGRVKARFLKNFNGARFKTVNGQVTAFLPQSASFAVDLSQVNGGFEASFPLSINSNPGSRRVSGEVNGGRHELRIVTVNGDVELARLTDSL